MKPKFKTVVKRSQWLRGTGNGKLRNTSGMMCCLGFRCEQAGVPAEELIGEFLPYQLRESGLPSWLNGALHNAAEEAAALNDSEAITDPEREAKIKLIFAEQGEEIEFVD